MGTKRRIKCVTLIEMTFIVFVITRLSSWNFKVAHGHLESWCRCFRLRLTSCLLCVLQYERRWRHVSPGLSASCAGGAAGVPSSRQTKIRSDPDRHGITWLKVSVYPRAAALVAQQRFGQCGATKLSAIARVRRSESQRVHRDCRD